MKKDFVGIKEMKQLVVDSFASELSQELYTERIEKGLLEYEAKIVREYFAKGERVLDLGCGVGRTSLAMAKMGYAEIVAVDIVSEFIEKAKKLASHQNVEYLVGDATDLGFEDSDFQNVFFSYNGWSQIPGKSQRTKALKEIYRVLKKDGVFYFSTMVFRKTPFMLWKWLKFKLAKLLKIRIWEADFGDVMFYRYSDFREKYFYRLPQKNKGEEMKIYMHFQTSFPKLLKELEGIGFEVVETQKTFQSWDAYQMQIVCRK